MENSGGTNIAGGGGRVTFMYEFTICDNSLKADYYIYYNAF
jgi:hypothetical protein